MAASSAAVCPNALKFEAHWNRKPSESSPILIAETKEQFEQFYKDYVRPEWRANNGRLVMGFDAEWVDGNVYRQMIPRWPVDFPSFADLDSHNVHLGQAARRGKISLIQFSLSNGTTLLIRTAMMADLPTKLRELIECDRVLKIGLDPENDKRRLRTDFDGLDPKGFLDIRFVVLRHKHFASHGSSKSNLRFLGKSVFGLDTEMEEAFRTSNWNGKSLTPTQTTYAARDSQLAMDLFLFSAPSVFLLDRSLDMRSKAFCKAALYECSPYVDRSYNFANPKKRLLAAAAAVDGDDASESSEYLCDDSSGSNDAKGPIFVGNYFELDDGEAAGKATEAIELAAVADRSYFLDNGSPWQSNEASAYASPFLDNYFNVAQPWQSPVALDSSNAFAFDTLPPNFSFADGDQSQYSFNRRVPEAVLESSPQVSLSTSSIASPPLVNDDIFAAHANGQQPVASFSQCSAQESFFQDHYLFDGALMENDVKRTPDIAAQENGFFCFERALNGTTFSDSSFVQNCAVECQPFVHHFAESEAHLPSNHAICGHAQQVDYSCSSFECGTEPAYIDTNGYFFHPAFIVDPRTDLPAEGTLSADVSYFLDPMPHQDKPSPSDGIRVRMSCLELSDTPH